LFERGQAKIFCLEKYGGDIKNYQTICAGGSFFSGEKDCSVFMKVCYSNSV